MSDSTDSPTTAPAATDSRKDAIELFLISMVSLFVELLIIRWMSADIRIFSVFKTFPLVTVFVGLGVGCAMGSDRLFRMTPWAMLLFVFIMRFCEFSKIGIMMTPLMGTQNYSWTLQADTTSTLYLGFFMLVLILILNAPFSLAVCIGSRLGVLFNNLPPLRAYCINVAGAIAGSVVFTLCSFLGFPPGLLLIPAAIVLVLYASDAGRLRWKAALPFLAAVVIANVVINGPTSPQATYWSPYQRLDMYPLHQPATFKEGTPMAGQHTSVDGYQLTSNSVPYQVGLDLTPERWAQLKVTPGVDEVERCWSWPFQLRDPGDVLILASGTGCEADKALRFGARSIDAVDIDPVIIKIGKTKHPLASYRSPKVNVVCDDARHFMNVCNKKYDLVVFSYLDSHTVTGIGSSVRLDNYVYTKEAVQSALRLLKPNGVVAMSFRSSKQWFDSRLYWTIRDAIGYAPLAYTDRERAEDEPSTFFVFGPGMQSGKISVPQAILQYCRALDPADKPQRILTDDWPYLYLSPVKIDWTYLAVVAEVVLLALYCARKIIFRPAPAANWQLFFMGSAFMLLELQFISRLAVLFGATWVTSAIVINGVLIMILIANLLAIKFREQLQPKTTLLYGGLVGSLVISFLTPTSLQLMPLGSALITLVTFLPILFAALIFATSFARVKNASMALAFNLLGGVVGALLEYLSNYIGINNVLMIAALLYLCSLAFFLRGEAKDRVIT